MKDKKVYIFIILLMVSLTFILVIFNYNKKDYVYLENGIPVINIDNASSINQEIKNIYNDKSKNIKYITYTNKNIYSLILDIEEYSVDANENLKSYISYNINLTNNEVITKEDLIKMFNFSVDDIISAATKLLKKYYDEEASEGYIEKNECSFDDYVKYIREIENLYDDITLFVKNNELYGYIPFHKNSIFEDSEYFIGKNDIFEFKI